MSAFMQDMVRFIRPMAAERLISVQSYAWTNNADCWTEAKYRMQYKNVLYEAHIYPWNPDIDQLILKYGQSASSKRRKYYLYLLVNLVKK